MIRHAGIAAAVLLMSCAHAHGQPSTPSPVTKPSPGVLSQMKTMVTKTATVDAIDATSRTVTVSFPSGLSEVVSVGPDVKRFSEVKVGDKIEMRYYESVVLQIRKPADAGSGAPSASPTTSDSSAATAGTGPRPGGTAARQRKATVAVLAIDRAAPSITVKTTAGHTVTRKVNDAKNLDGLAVGDKIDITYTEAMLVHVVPAK
jgi:hypothetical protein